MNLQGMTVTPLVSKRSRSGLEVRTFLVSRDGPEPGPRQIAVINRPALRSNSDRRFLLSVMRASLARAAEALELIGPIHIGEVD